MSKKKIIFAANDPNLGLGTLAYSGVFPDDFSVMMILESSLIVGVASICLAKELLESLSIL